MFFNKIRLLIYVCCTHLLGVILFYTDILIFVCVPALIFAISILKNQLRHVSIALKFGEMAFTFVAFAYMLALIFTAFLIFFAIYHIIAFDELKTDYKNPIDQCNSLNPLVLPEYAVHLTFCVLFLLGLQFGSLLWNVPLLAYHIHRYMNRPKGMSKAGLYDPTTIMNQGQLSRAMREGWIKLAFYLISFFYYLYSMIYTLITSE